MNFINIAVIISALVQMAKAESAAASASLDLERSLNLDETLTNSTATDPDTETAATTAEDPSDATAGGFSLIDGEFSAVESVTISPLCPWDTRTFFPNTVFTIQPSTGASYVSSFPANLVTPTVSGGELQIEWNGAVAGGAKSGAGVRIGLPPDQFKKLSIASAVTAQVLDGFTSVQSLEVSGASTLKAMLTSNENSDLPVSVDGASTVDAIFANAIGSVEAQGASTVRVQADSVNGSITVDGVSRLYIDGSFGGSGTISGASTVTITGEMSGVLDNSGTSTINANTITGVIDNSGVSTVNAVSCDNVNSGDMISSCNVSGPPAEDMVDVPPLFDAVSTSSLGSQCSVSGGTWNSGTWNSGTSLGSSISVAIAAVAGATTLVAFLLM